MLNYLEFCLSHMEVPGESCLTIYITGCQNMCVNCHYPELHNPSSGMPLYRYFGDMLNLYFNQITCVCFMGEGNADEESRSELSGYASKCIDNNLKTCLYCGRDTVIEDWMHIFDYIKTGRYIDERGPLTATTTNQHMYMKVKNGYTDITNRFWNDNRPVHI